MQVKCFCYWRNSSHGTAAPRGDGTEEVVFKFNAIKEVGKVVIGEPILGHLELRYSWGFAAELFKPGEVYILTLEKEAK